MDQTDPSATWSVPQDPISTGAFWAQGEPAPRVHEQPPAQHGWPLPPEQPEVTGRLTGLPQAPPPAGSLPPEPGDVKVAGSPTLANAPAWADAKTTFLGSGWSSEEDLDADLDDDLAPRRRGRRRPAGQERPPSSGRGRIAVLAVTAVAIVLGGSVAGVRMMSSGDPASDCPGGTCAAASNQPIPTFSDTEPAPEEDAAEASEPLAEEESSPTPTAAPQRAPRRTPAARPTGTTKVKAKHSQEPAEEASDESGEPDASPQGTDTPTIVGNVDTGTEPSPTSSSPATSSPTAAPTSEPSVFSQNAGSVSVTFDVVRRRGSAYTARVDVTNTSAGPLSDLTVSMPVGGEVADVQGADWTQDGDLLILELPGRLEAGASVDVLVRAYGAARTPRTCGAIGADCVMG
ncbi:hypothetical protein [Thermoactinospora rubra]|uniref:hypothetical protein n=1 Tax=Thermoactinospora rubra TaxID=1088767 RepID=UPI001301A82A|nr:hypothetical protein [Thermoactinospora rubra]